jgi:hypothetical protein
MDAQPGEEVDHRDLNGLNNQKYNLRKCTHAENSRNRIATSASGFKGVSWHKRRGKWEAHIRMHGRKRYLGSFDNPVLAARCYDVAARRLFGSFARTNFSDYTGD